MRSNIIAYNTGLSGCLALVQCVMVEEHVEAMDVTEGREGCIEEHEKIELAMPTVLGLGCDAANDAFRDLGMVLESVPSMGHLLQPDESLLQARAIVIHLSSLGFQGALSVVGTLQERYPLIDLVLWAPEAPSAQIRELLRAGAKDVELSADAAAFAAAVMHVIETQQLLPRVQKLQERPPERTEFEELRSRNRKMWDLFDLAIQIAPTSSSVLILGETGTGKELFARAIHARSGRSGRFVAVNCGAIPEHLIDSEFFGHVKGAFTGAVANKQGLFRYADGGTLLLDELGTIPLDVQFRLLRVLQEGLIRPVGGHEEVPVDVRVIAATNAPIEVHVASGQFREDLYYRLDVLRIEIPPLRQRKEDILFLFSLLMRQFVDQYQIERPQLGDELLELMLSYEWPGNVRELENFAERLVLTQHRGVVGAEHFYRLIRGPHGARGQARTGPGRPSAQVHPTADAALFEVDTSKPLEDHVRPVLARIERAYIEACLRDNAGRIGDTAIQAGINRRTLLRKMKMLGIDKNDFRKRRSP